MLSPHSLEFLKKIDRDSLIVVEGKKDVEALRSLGFKKIIKISGKSLEKVAEEIVSKKPLEVTILTDFDEEGESMALRLSNIISRHKIKTNHFIRKKFMSLKIHKIEELNSLTKLIGDDQSGEISSIYYKIFNRSRVQSRRNCRKARCDRSNIWSNRGIVRPRS